MHKRLLLILGIMLLLGTTAAQADIFEGIYWIAGAINLISAPPTVDATGSRVVFYRNQGRWNEGFASGLVGSPGLDPRPNRYALNACSRYPLLTIAPGTYWIASVQKDGWGVNETQVTVTGYGYELVDLNYVANGGIIGVTDEGFAPRITDITFGNRKYQAQLVAKGQEFITSSQPRIAVRIASPFGINLSGLQMLGASAPLDIRSSHIVQASGPSGSPTELGVAIDLAQERLTLTEGAQDVTFRASNAFGTATEICHVTVAGGDARVIGIPITYPSPVHLRTDTQVTFQYTLSRNMSVQLVLFDVSGQIVRRVTFAEGAEGGSAGINKVTWDLKTQQGGIVSSGIYVFTLLNMNDGGKLLAKGKLTTLP